MNRVMLTPTFPNSHLEYTPLRAGPLLPFRLPQWDTVAPNNTYWRDVNTKSWLREGLTWKISALLWCKNAPIQPSLFCLSPLFICLFIEARFHRSPGLSQPCHVAKAATELLILLVQPPGTRGAGRRAICWMLSVQCSMSYFRSYYKAGIIWNDFTPLQANISALNPLARQSNSAR